MGRKGTNCRGVAVSNISRYLASSIWSRELVAYATEQYSAGTPVITDATFDILEKQYPTNTVGAKPSSAFEKARHAVPMGSLSKAQTESDIRNWIRGLGRNPWPLFVSDKLDGISISVEYKNGKLVRAATRGDGAFGEDITKNVLIMRGVKRSIPGFSGFIRGEIVVKRSDFHNFPDASNTRNSAAGAAKSQHDNSKAAFCSVIFYRVIPNYESKEEEFNQLKSWGLEVPSAFLVDNFQDIMKIYNYYVAERRENLDYDIDGLVIEIDDTEKAFSVGTDPAHPEYAIAFKFPHAEGETTLRAVEWQVGNTGRVTPVAVFDEVNLAGANITRASLATVGLLRSKGLEIGSRIVVSRRNDVIPMVERAITKGTSPVDIAKECPSCGHELESEGEYILCPNIGACPAQLQGAILNYTKKIGVLEWGDTVVRSICDRGLAKELSDIYWISQQKLAMLDSDSGRILGEKTAQKMIRNLDEKSSLPLHVFIGALGIKGVGRTMCKLLVEAGFDTIEKMRKAKISEIAAVDGFGPTRAYEFVVGMKEREDVIDSILEKVKIEKAASGAMTGKSACMTGFRDADLAAEIERQGGSIKSSVGKGLTYLVQKDASSVSEKSKKAISLGVKVISIDDMWRILGR